MAHRPNSTGYRRGSGASSSRQAVKGIHSEKRQIVGQYMVGKTIGEGTFGKVKLAVHIPTGEKVAVKILEKNRIKEQADVRRVNREIKILKKARHGNVVQLYEVLDTKNTIYLIMECADGGEMFDFIVAQKRVPEPQSCKFLHQILDGLEVLHNNDITHRDLKPENLLLKATPDGWIVKIVDFGLSNTHEGGRLLSTACGSPCYAAPEMIAGKKYVGPLADLWSLGVILFALVSGFLPFEDPDTSRLYKKILAAEYRCPKWISPEVKDLIGCILETEPRKRYTIADIRRHPWYSIVPEATVPHETFAHEHNMPVDPHNPHTQQQQPQVPNSYSQNQTHNQQLTKQQSETRADTMSAIVAAGMDPQAVMDSVASCKYNSLTAMYYLLEQKHRAQRLLKKAHSSKSQIRQNSSTFSKPETNASNSSNAGSLHGPAGQQHGFNQPVHPVRVSGVHGQQQHSQGAYRSPQVSPRVAVNSAGVPIKPQPHQPHQPAMAPYLQPPKILQPHHQSLHHNHDKGPASQSHGQQTGNMPSLDQYMKGAIELPVTSDKTAATAPSSRGPADSSSAQQKTKMRGKVPHLNLKADPVEVQREQKLLSLASTAEKENGERLCASGPPAPVYVSQTSRQPDKPVRGSVKGEAGAGELAGAPTQQTPAPASARAALPSLVTTATPQNKTAMVMMQPKSPKHQDLISQAAAAAAPAAPAVRKASVEVKTGSGIGAIAATSEAISGNNGVGAGGEVGENGQVVVKRASVPPTGPPPTSLKAGAATGSRPAGPVPTISAAASSAAAPPSDGNSGVVVVGVDAAAVVAAAKTAAAAVPPAGRPSGNSGGGAGGRRGRNISFSKTTKGGDIENVSVDVIASTAPILASSSSGGGETQSAVPGEAAAPPQSRSVVQNVALGGPVSQRSQHQQQASLAPPPASSATVGNATVGSVQVTAAVAASPTATLSNSLKLKVQQNASSSKQATPAPTATATASADIVPRAPAPPAGASPVSGGVPQRPMRPQAGSEAVSAVGGVAVSSAASAAAADVAKPAGSRATAAVNPRTQALQNRLAAQKGSL